MFKVPEPLNKMSLELVLFWYKAFAFIVDSPVPEYVSKFKEFVFCAASPFVGFVQVTVTPLLSIKLPPATAARSEPFSNKFISYHKERWKVVFVCVTLTLYLIYAVLLPINGLV
jgi:hypothetical protein